VIAIIKVLFTSYDDVGTPELRRSDGVGGHNFNGLHAVFRMTRNTYQLKNLVSIKFYGKCNELVVRENIGCNY